MRFDYLLGGQLAGVSGGGAGAAERGTVMGLPIAEIAKSDNWKSNVAAD
jgi:hypothetical protein